MKDNRSRSQILFGFLPEQTVDVRAAIWKVSGWRAPRTLGDVDSHSLAREIRKAAAPWRAAQTDGGLVNDLERGHTVRVVGLDSANGVNLEPFPRIWYCKRCRQIHTERAGKCPCGAVGDRSQLHFVAFHNVCGVLREPPIRRCPQHGVARINFPGTASAREITFTCPKCNWVQKGFPQAHCSCGRGMLSINVHRSSSVFTPREIVIVNPPRRDAAKKLFEYGGPARALAWMLSGMKESTLEQVRATASSLREQLKASGMPPEVVEAAVAAARNSGVLNEESTEIEGLTANQLEEAENQAMSVALATSTSRRRFDELRNGADPTSELGMLYATEYPQALSIAGLAAVELVDRFPILTGHFAYTRGEPEVGRSKLVSYKDRSGDYLVYGDLMETESLFFRLSPIKVVDWLRNNGFNVAKCSDARSAFLEIVRNAQIPGAGTGDGVDTLGGAVLTLVHSYAHRVIRSIAATAGIERSSLAEYLVPLHLGFYVYAAVRGDFVLGGLEAVFETELDKVLRDIVYAEHRCALDPGCSKAGGACMSCLHVGEPSCRLWNTFLGRHVLFGESGYLTS